MDELPVSAAFDMYFTGIVSIQYHPKNIQEHGCPQMDLDQCAQVALDMLIVRARVLEGLKGQV